MTDNEKRAHDLAIEVMKINFDTQKSNATANHKDFTFDFYAEYKSIYEQSLEAFNRDFS